MLNPSTDRTQRLLIVSPVISSYAQISSQDKAAATAFVLFPLSGVKLLMHSSPAEVKFNDNGEYLRLALKVL